MEKLVLFVLVGSFLGMALVEFTYRFLRGWHLNLYFLSLPIKLLLWALVFLMCYIKGGVSGLLACILGFIFGFLFMLSLRGFVKSGGAKVS